jgi:hypothetical protein
MSDTTNQVEEPNASVNQPGAAPDKKPAIHPLLVISGILSLFAGTFSLFALSYIPDLIEWAQSPDNVVPLTTWSYLLVFVLTPVLAYGNPRSHLCIGELWLRRTRRGEFAKKLCSSG